MKGPPHAGHRYNEYNICGIPDKLGIARYSSRLEQHEEGETGYR